MKHFKFASLIAVLLLASCSCANNNTQPYYPKTDTGIPFTPTTDEDPFPEYVPPEIDTHDFVKTAIPVNLTAVNDFHGQIDEEVDDHRVGLAKMSTFLKSRKSQGDILISSGDMYQGSFLAGIDHGQFVSYAFKNIGFDAYVLGNHEFDWGVQYIVNNQAALGQNFLCANIYNYPYHTNNPIKSSLGDDYKIITLYPGTQYQVKVGVIGVIGKNQITSITSTYVEDYVFIDPTSIVKKISVKLRDEQKCDYVIASYHDAEPDESIAQKVNNKSYKYVDACFMAHTHHYDYKVVNGVPFIQASAYSRGVSTVKFTYNKNTKESTLVDSKYEYLSEKSLSADSIMVEQIGAKKALHEKEYTEIVGENATGQTLDVGQMSQFYAKMTYDKAVEKYKPDYNIVGCIFNESRRGLKEGEFTYSEIYETHPFLNSIYILSVSQKDILNEKKYAYGYINPDTYFSETVNLYYDVLVFDYNGFHISIDNQYKKRYNFFPSAFESGAKHQPYKIDFTCLDATLEYLKETPITNEFFATEGLFAKMS